MVSSLQLESYIATMMSYTNPHVRISKETREDLSHYTTELLKILVIAMAIITFVYVSSPGLSAPGKAQI